MKGQILEAFYRGNEQRLMGFARNLPESINHDLRNLLAKYNECNRIVSPLSAAIFERNYHICKLFIEDGASLVQTFKDQYHPLSLALLENEPDIAVLIIDSGADVTKVEYDGSCAIFWAIKKGHPARIIQLILSAGFPVNSISLELLQYRAIHIAALEGHLDAVQILIKNSSDLNVPGSEGDTPLLLAVRRNHFEIVELLVKHGAHLNNDEISPLLSAIDNKQIRMMEKLLDLGASVESGSVNKLPISPLLYAIRFALDENVINLLLSRGANINTKNQLSGESVLHAVSDAVLDNSFKNVQSVRIAQVKIAKILINHGADINAVDDNGFTSLHLAIARENREISTFLLKQGAKLADVKRILNKDDESHTAFECVVGSGNLASPELIRLCLEQGADYNYRTQLGPTMYHYAKEFNNEEIIKYFWQHGCPYDQETHMLIKIASVLFQRSKDKVKKLMKIQSYFILGVKEGNLANVLKSLEQGAEPKGCSVEIPSTLHYVASKGYHELTRVLLERGVPVNRLNAEGVTALYLAVQGGHLKTCEVLLEFGACYCPRGSVDNKDIGLLVKSHEDIYKMFQKISKCFRLTKLGDSAMLKVVQQCFMDMLPVFMNCVNRQGLTLTGLALRLGHSQLAADLMALRVDKMTIKD